MVIDMAKNSSINLANFPYGSFGVFIRAPYNYDCKKVSDDNGLVCPEPTLTQQQFADDCDPNVIMERYARTHDISLLNVRVPEYGDFTNISDYHSAFNAVLEAQESFMELDAKVRARFNNDPGHLLDFLSDPANRDEAVALGLVGLSTPPEARNNSAGEQEGVEKPSSDVKKKEVKNTSKEVSKEGSGNG